MSGVDVWEAMASVGKVATIRGRDFSIRGGVMRVEARRVVVGVPVPCAPRDPRGASRPYHDFEVPLEMVEAIER